VSAATVIAVTSERPDFQAYCGDEPPRFVNQAEIEVAKLLDYYGIRWEYEPHSFVLETDAEGRVVEAATPDFYLPDQDLYLEVTTMKQSLVTRKNRKIRKLRERYPDLNVKLFYKRDIDRLAGKYGLDLVS
jgi:hypoxanthine phosphoribosyltransferase